MPLDERGYYKNFFVSLLESKRVSRLTSDAFRLWVHMYLAADDYGYLECDPCSLRAGCLSMVGEVGRRWSVQRIENALAELVDAPSHPGLIEVIEGEGKRVAEMLRYCEMQRPGQGKHRKPSKLLEIIARVQGGARGCKGVHESARDRDRVKEEKETPHTPLTKGKGGRGNSSRGESRAKATRLTEFLLEHGTRITMINTNTPREDRVNWLRKKLGPENLTTNQFNALIKMLNYADLSGMPSGKAYERVKDVVEAALGEGKEKG